VVKSAEKPSKAENSTPLMYSPSKTRPASPKMDSTVKRIPPEAQQSVPLTNTNLQSSDLTAAGKIVGQDVQLLVDTGACVSARDVKFFKETYGQLLPKMVVDSLPSV